MPTDNPYLPDYGNENSLNLEVIFKKIHDVVDGHEIEADRDHIKADWWLGQLVLYLCDTTLPDGEFKTECEKIVKAYRERADRDWWYV